MNRFEKKYIYSQVQLISQTLLYKCNFTTVLLEIIINVKTKFS